MEPTRTPDPMRLSIVTTLYRSAPYIEEFHRRISVEAARVTPDYEILFVDDGSPDDSLQVAIGLTAVDPHVRVIELSRNFGHHRAIMTGLRRARGELVFLIDVDLEEAPEWLARFHDMLRAEDSDVVYGYQEQRKGGWLERSGGALHWWLIRLLSDYPIPHSHVTARLMKQGYVRSLLRHREQHTALGGLWALTGYRQRGAAVTKGWRGTSSYSFTKRMALVLEGLTAFSDKPLMMVFAGGVGIFLLASVIAAALIVRRLTGVVLDGWVSVMVSVWILGGLCIASVGVVGLYTARIFMETKRRPYSIVRATYGYSAGQHGQT
jgi:putative glycosyltransferase